MDTIVSAGLVRGGAARGGRGGGDGRRAARGDERGARRAASLHRPPGHHAEAGAGDGLLPVQQRRDRRRSTRSTPTGRERVLIFDWDVHHGNGTNDIFHERDDVLFCSIHQSPLYPGTGPASDVGRGAGRGLHGEPAGAGRLGRRGVPVARRARRAAAGARLRAGPLLLSAGYDAHADDPLAGCRVTDAGYAGDGRARCARRPTSSASRSGIVLEGGYDLGGAVALAWWRRSRSLGAERGAGACRRWRCTAGAARRRSGWRRTGRRWRSARVLDARYVGRRRRVGPVGRVASCSRLAGVDRLGEVVVVAPTACRRRGRRLRRRRGRRRASWSRSASSGRAPSSAGAGRRAGAVRRRRRRRSRRGGGVMIAGGAVSTTAVGVVAGVGTSSSSVSLTKANASSAPAIAMIAPIATVGSCQFGVGARRVRAGAPHSRHQSCSGPTGAEQRGQRIEPGSGSCGGGGPASRRLGAHEPSSCAVRGPHRLGSAAAAAVARRRRRVCGRPGLRVRLAAAPSAVRRAPAARVAADPRRRAEPAAARRSRPRPRPSRAGRRSAARSCGQKFESLECSAPQRAQDGDARLAQLVDRAAVVEDALERAQLLVDGGQRADLRLDRSGRSRPKRRMSKISPPMSRNASSRVRRRKRRRRRSLPRSRKLALRAGAGRQLLDDDLVWRSPERAPGPAAGAAGGRRRPRRPCPTAAGRRRACQSGRTEAAEEAGAAAAR